MRSQVVASEPLFSPGSEEGLGDLRFRALMSEADWRALPLSIRRRFSKRLAGGRTVVYVGEVIETKMSRFGWLLAQAARLIGGPLPISRDAHVPSVVTVTEDVATSGQHWTRLYARRVGFPHIVHSSKRFAGPTGLEEYVGYGVGMALTIHVEDKALIFRAAHYFLQLGRVRLRLPAWATPGDLAVTHAELGDGRFLFRLDINHPRLGRLICQTAAFREANQRREAYDDAALELDRDPNCDGILRHDLSSRADRAARLAALAAA